MRFFGLFLFINLLWVNASFAGPHRTLILNLSDWHAHYGNLPQLIQAISYVSQDFLKENPEGDVVIVVNGDFVGYQGGWTQFVKPDFPTDHGRLGYEVLALLAYYAHVVMVPGNHDEFDWTMDSASHMGYGEGLRLFKAHRLQFATAMERIHKRPFRMAAANIVAGRDGSELFEPYTDVPLKNGKTLRFVGGVLEEFFNKTNYRRWDKVGPAPSNYLDIIREVGPLVPAVAAQMEQAGADGLEGVVVAIHDENQSLKQVAQAIDQMPRLKGLKNPLWVGGHNHTPEITLEGGKHFIQGGSHGDFTRIVLGEGFQVESLENFSVAKQAALLANWPAHPNVEMRSIGLNIKVGEETEVDVPSNPRVRLQIIPDTERTHVLGVNRVDRFHLETSESFVAGLRPYELLALAKAKKEVARIKKGRPDKVLGETKGFAVTKSLMRAGREELGTLIAEVLVQHGMTVEPPIGSGIVVLGDVAFFNSSSFRKDDPTPPGLLTSMTLAEWAPFSNRPVGVFFLSGAELEGLFFSLRHYFAQRNLYSPQINASVREVFPNKTATVREIGERLQMKSSAGRWDDINRSGIYRVTMDPWLANNDYKLPVWDETLKRSESMNAHLAHQPTFISIMEKHASLFGCDKLLKAAGDQAVLPPPPKTE